MKQLKSKEALFLRDIWRKAFTEGTLELHFKTKAGAIRARLALYNAVKAGKQGSDEDPLINQAAEALEICISGPTSLIMRKRSESDYIKGLEEALGKSLSEQEDPVLMESMNKLLEKLGPEAAALALPPEVLKPEPPAGDEPPLLKVKNPFFER